MGTAEEGGGDGGGDGDGDGDVWWPQRVQKICWT